MENHHGFCAVPLSMLRRICFGCRFFIGMLFLRNGREASLIAGDERMLSAKNNVPHLLYFLVVWRWWAMRDSNPRPAVCKTAALTAAPIALFPLLWRIARATLESCRSQFAIQKFQRGPGKFARSDEALPKRARQSSADHCLSSNSRMTRAVQPV